MMINNVSTGYKQLKNAKTILDKAQTNLRTILTQTKTNFIIFTYNIKLHKLL